MSRHRLNELNEASLQVIFYTDAMGVGGAEISLGHLVSQLSPAITATVVGVSTAVVTAIAANCPQATCLVLPRGRAIAAHITTFHRLNPDLVHLNLCTPWAGAIGVAAALTLPKARVVRVDQLPLRTTDAIELWRTRALALRVDAHVAVGEASARRMEDFYALGRNRVLSIPNGVPQNIGNNLINVPRRNTVLSIPNGVPDIALSATEPSMHQDYTLTVGSVGRLDAMKAHDILLQSIAQVADVQVVILGEGEQRAALEQLAMDLGIRDRVVLPGWVDNPRAYLPNFDVFVLPSRSEGFPLAIVEAMLAAHPVIATNVGSVAEAVIHGETGLLIEKDDVMGLVAALQRLKADGGLRGRLGQRRREVAVAQFTAAQMAQRYEQIWRDILAKPRSPRFRIPRPCD